MRASEQSVATQSPHGQCLSYLEWHGGTSSMLPIDIEEGKWQVFCVIDYRVTGTC